MSVHLCNGKSKGPGFDSWGMPLLFVPQYIVYTFSATFCWSYAIYHKNLPRTSKQMASLMLLATLKAIVPSDMRRTKPQNAGVPYRQSFSISVSCSTQDNSQ